ncbi:hypothetical protein B1813_03540 [Saccharomonospora piscinae]|uniref:Uncharacterized protein n=1 Tax=Saccharomonospora piscinae TaxID=687388 RepID=A0A1V9A994_SACPI|nr:hypothetical protein [Saccharomonospora piscinae]OQO93630.1 hypothetical protein B1813_03540 [Saccharomonospora piscinae]TLW94790.1 hypothetical protein FFT09_02680 [Saccharomonospora piscinae]
MLKPAANVLKDLAQYSNISLRSDSSLVGAVVTAAAHDDEQRAKKQAEKDTKDKDDKDTALRRKPGLKPVPAWGGRSIEITPWDVLHVLGRAIALSRRGAARGLAEHWGALKYSQALTGDTRSFMKLSAEGKMTAEHYKNLQSRELGIGFALVAAQRVLTQRYPDRVVSIVPADTTLSAGWSARGTYRPQYFAELWKPGEPSLVLPIACKGNHSNAARSYSQLASASAHVETVHIGPWNETPVFIFSTELPPDGHVTVHALCALGRGGWLSRPHAESEGLDVKLSDENYFPEIRLPTESDNPPSSVTGFHVTPERYEWFRRVIARTDAAGLTAFAGDGGATTQYLTDRQGAKNFTGFAHAAAGSVQDVAHTLFGIRFTGTDHVFRLNGTRVEAFSGVADDLLHLLAEGRVEQYRREIYERRSSWPSNSSNVSWNGPVSVHPDGTVLAMRLLS